MLIVLILIAAISFPVELGSQNCRGPWNGFRACMKSHYNDYSKQRRLEDGARISLENKIRACYKSQKCFDPFPSAPITNARRDCHRQVRDALKKQLTECMKQSFTDYDLTDEDDLVYAWAQDEMYLNAVELDSKACPPGVDRFALHDCVRTAIGTVFANNPSRSMCDSRWDCIRAQNMERICYDRWQSAADLLCDCAGHVSLADLKEKYLKCMSQKNFASAVSDATDYNGRWLDNAQSRYCNTKLDSPCGGFGGLSAVDASRLISAFIPSKGMTGLNPNSILTGIGSGNLSGITDLLTSVGRSSPSSFSSSSSSASASSALSNIVNLLGLGKSRGFGSLLGGQGLSYDFLSGKQTDMS